MKTNPEKTIYYFDEDPGYDTIKNITNGYFRTLKLTDGRTMFLNGEGENTCYYNNEASNIYGICIYGTIVIVGKINS